MTFYAALDVSLDKTAVCVMGHDGSIVREIEVATCPEALARCLGKIAPAFELVGLEAGPMSEWLVRGLARVTRFERWRALRAESRSSIRD